jgi:CPA2 family monovalent cation:H+ antiporter-2
VALGAFMIGAIVGESQSVERIERIIGPVRDMFSAIFFVAIGMLIDPAMLKEYWLPIIVVTTVVVLGKVITCSFGTFVAGNDGRTSLRVGMGLAQIGEFSFVIASLGLTLKVTSGFLYPVAVAVSAITTFLTPYLIRASDPLASGLSRRLPQGLTGLLSAYTDWMGNLSLGGQGVVVAKMIRRLVWHVIINMMLVVAAFLIMSYLYRRGFFHWDWLADSPQVKRSLAWSIAAIVSLPMIVAAYRKASALGMLLAELSIPERIGGAYNMRIRAVMARFIPLATMWVLGLLVAALASTILPPREVAIVLVLVLLLLAWLLWHLLVQVHARLQAALRDTLDKPGRSGEGHG